MSRISGFLATAEMQLVNRLNEANAATALDTLRLAAKKRILAPRDDPSTFITLAGLQTQLNSVVSVMGNATAAHGAVSQASSAIEQIRDQLDTIREELLKDPSQQGQSQQIIDAAVTQINTLTGTDIGGRQLLDGSANFTMTGGNAGQVRQLEVYAKPPGSTMVISGAVTRAATQATLSYTGDDQPTSHPVADAEITLAGKRGSASFSVAATQTLDDVATAINAKSYLTGVGATVSGKQLSFTSVDYGASAAVSIQVTSGSFVTTGTGTAVDAQATINGVSYTGKGNSFTVNNNGLSYQMQFTSGFAGDFSPITVSGDALRYQLSTSLNQPSILAIPGLQANRLGGVSGTVDQIASGGRYSGLGSNTSQAIQIVDEAIGQLDTVQGNVSGFQKASIDSSSKLMDQLQVELQDSIVQTDGFDEPQQQSLLVYHQQLAANAAAGLTILYQQRYAAVQMLQQIAGLNQN